jgi:hypothetical protein
MWSGPESELSELTASGASGKAASTLPEPDAAPEAPVVAPEIAPEGSAPEEPVLPALIPDPFGEPVTLDLDPEAAHESPPLELSTPASTTVGSSMPKIALHATVMGQSNGIPSFVRIAKTRLVVIVSITRLP